MFLHALALAAALALASCGRETVRYATQDVPVDAGGAAALVSAYRASHGLGAVGVDGRLNQIALRQARAIAAIGDLSHDIAGSFASRLSEFDADRSSAAENLSAGPASLDALIAQWKGSPEHNRNLLLSKAQRIGIARVDAPQSRYKRYWVLVLADR